MSSSFVSGMMYTLNIIMPFPMSPTTCLSTAPTQMRVSSNNSRVAVSKTVSPLSRLPAGRVRLGMGYLVRNASLTSLTVSRLTTKVNSLAKSLVMRQ